MKSVIATLLSTAVALAAIAAWYKVVPMPHSGWVLFVAFLGSLHVLDANNKNVLAGLSGLIIAAAAGSAWYFGQSMPHSGWILALAILAGLRTFKSLQDYLSDSTSKEQAPPESESTEEK